ncbi:hypothetical protein [Roseofilum capinflatum]|uniref:Uncharacterized protein n=1 Tax=Roseofilum capinflatum BLCC-M114 TaxID=3022440 RepID=A0ABT7B8Y3_9CYAN|nr:hypothetical protein [Roseofilum capinflatum]MDJ1175636.1 hypothetical protein [Roseofilum capinflatum BLCC-M114]
MLNTHDTYTCPLCRHGQISALTLMDAFACNFCRHIFSANLQQQTLQLADGDRPFAWYWTGKTWINATMGRSGDRSYLLWLLSLPLILLPPTLIGLASYIFPPDPQSSGAWLPLVWTGLTLLTHLLLVAWLMFEYYQWPFFQAILIRWQQRLSPR